MTPPLTDAKLEEIERHHQTWCTKRTGTCHACSLLADNKRLREVFETQTGLYEQAVSDRARLTDERDEARAELANILSDVCNTKVYNNLQETNLELKTENARLREALEEAADALDDATKAMTLANKFNEAQSLQYRATQTRRALEAQP